MDSKRIVIVGVIGGGRAARMSMALQAAGMAVLMGGDSRTVERPPTIPEPRPGAVKLTPFADGSSRQRAQWKAETNKRGRNR